MTRFRSRSPGAGLLFDRLSLSIAEGDRIGLVGSNGSGKSTLLRLLAGLERPVEGEVVRAPGVRVAHLPQTAAEPVSGSVLQAASTGLDELFALRRRLASEEARIAAGEERGEQHAWLSAEHERLGGYGAEARVREILAALGFPEARHQEPAAALSSGERQRLALAAVLAAEADVVLLDEPTNNLDIDARVWLEQHLARQAGALLLVSHDRALLSAATTKTAFLAGGRLRLESGDYDRATARRLSSAEARRQRQRAAEARRVERIARDLARHGARRSTGGRAAAAATERRSRVRGRLVSADHLRVTGVLDDAAVRLDAGDRIALLGPNGSGKSTLLSLLAGERASEDPRAQLAYAPGLKLVTVPQRGRGLSPHSTLLEQARDLLGDGAAQGVLAKAGVRHAAWSSLPAQLSGGERARAGLALALARPFDLLLLDEPDNDLDLEALEAFEETLAGRLEETGAALLLATHDRRLALSLATRAWSIDGGRLLAHGSVRAFLRGEEAIPASRFWEERGSNEGGSPAAHIAGASLAQRTPGLEALIEELEAERTALLELQLDPMASSERERARAEERLGEVEERLMALYDERLLPPGPNRRLVERGLVIYADRAQAHGGAPWDAAPADPAPARREPATDRDGPTAPSERWAALPAPDPLTAASALRRPEHAGVPWLELTRVGDGAHLRLHGVEGACLLPWARGALLDAGVRLSFTVLGVRFTQHFSRAAPTGASNAGRSPATLLDELGDGWWGLTLERFLDLEGWRMNERGRAPRRDKGD